jgi:hypothetical protein
MKKLIGIVLVTMTIGTPAFAQYYETSNRPGYWATGRAVTPPRAFIQGRGILRRTVLRAVAPRKHSWRILELRGYRRRRPGYNQLLMTW